MKAPINPPPVIASLRDRMDRLEGKVETLIAAFTKPGTRAAAAVVFLAAGSLAVAAQERGPDREPQIAAQYREELQPDVMLVDEIGRQRPGNRCGTPPYTGPLDPVLIYRTTAPHLPSASVVSRAVPQKEGRGRWPRFRRRQSRSRWTC